MKYVLILIEAALFAFFGGLAVFYFLNSEWIGFGFSSLLHLQFVESFEEDWEYSKGIINDQRRK